MIEKPDPTTNVISLLSGGDVSKNICEGLKSFIVTTMPIPWELAKGRIGGNPIRIVFVDSMERERVEQQLEELPEFECVVAIGGGQAIDLGKYFSRQKSQIFAAISSKIKLPDHFFDSFFNFCNNWEFFQNCSSYKVILPALSEILVRNLKFSTRFVIF